MQGVITRVHVLAHPLVIVEGFGMKVLVRALLADASETFLEVVTRCAEEEAHEGMATLDLLPVVERFTGYECRARDLYRRLAEKLAGLPEVARFFETLGRHEEGHAIVLARVRRELRRGRLWPESKDLHFAGEEALAASLAALEKEAEGEVGLARALDIVEAVEGSELNVVFDALSGCVDMRSRARFESFFVLTREHLAYCREQIRDFRKALDPKPAPAAPRP